MLCARTAAPRQAQRQGTVWSSTCQRNSTSGDASPQPVQLMRQPSPMRAISSAICPVESRFGATFGLLISGSFVSSHLEVGERRLRRGQARFEGARSASFGDGRAREREEGVRGLDAQRVGEDRDAFGSVGTFELHAGVGCRTRVAIESFGFGDGLRSGRGEERVEPVEAVAVEHAGGFRDALDLVEEAVALDAVRRILERVLGEHDHEAGRDAGPLAAQDAAHALDHLAPGAARAHDDAEVRVGNVDAFVEHPRRGDRVELADAEIVEDLAPLTRARWSR